MARSVNASPYFNKKLIVPFLTTAEHEPTKLSDNTQSRSGHIDLDIKLPSFSSNFDNLPTSSSVNETPTELATTPGRHVEFTSPRTVQGGMASDGHALGSELGSAFTVENSAADRSPTRNTGRLRKSTLLASLVRANLNDSNQADSQSVSEAAAPASDLSSYPDASILTFVLNDDQPSVREKVDQLLRDMEERPDDTTTSLLNGILALAGVHYAVSLEDLRTEDPSIILEACLRDESLIRAAPGGNLFKNKTALSRLSGLFKGLGTFGLGIDQVVCTVNDILIPWLMTLSAVSLRALRVSSTIAGLSLLIGGSECARALQRSAESTKRVSKKIVPMSEKIAACERCLQSIFEIVFVQRYRDVNVDIRIYALQSLIHCMQSYPIVFVDNAFLRYLGWSLTDPSSHVRHEALQALYKLYASMETSLVASFTERFQERLVQVVQRDRANRIKALAVLDLAVSKGLITLDLKPLVQSFLTGLLTSEDEWKKCKNILTCVFGDGKLFLVLDKLLDASEPDKWQPSVESLARVYPLEEAKGSSSGNHYAVFWTTVEDIPDWIGRHGLFPNFVWHHLARLIKATDDNDMLRALYVKCSETSGDACRILVPKLNESLTQELMAALSVKPEKYHEGILALSSVVAPTVVPHAKSAHDMNVLQLEYRRLLWCAKNNTLVPDEALNLFTQLSLLLEDIGSPLASVAAALGMWTDLILLSHRKSAFQKRLHFEEGFIDGVVKRVHGHVEGERALGLSIGKLLLANLINSQTALRDLCAITGAFPECTGLMELACERYFLDASMSLAQKLTFAKGVLLVRSDLVKAFLNGVRTALQLQSDDAAIRQFIMQLARQASHELWQSISMSFLLRNNGDLKTEALNIRTANASVSKGSKRRPVKQRDRSDAQESTASEPTSSLQLDSDYNVVSLN
jgi:hypothetical protein